MDRKTLEKLEFNKIILKLKELTASVIGGELAESLEPSADIDEIRWMQKETNDALMLSVKRGIPPLGGIRDIRSSLRRAEISAALNPGELLNVADVLRVSRSLKKYAGDDTGTVDGNYVAGFIGKLAGNKALEDRINNAIISPEEISDSASTALNNIRRKIRNLQSSIKDKLDSIVKSQSVKKYIQEAIVTIREDRYVIPVKAEYKNEVHGLVHDSSASGATLFIEPMAVVEANNEIKEQKIKEKAEIERILAELTQEVLEMLDSLKENMLLLAKIDFAFAKAKLSADYRCTGPTLNDEGRILIKKGRHPLLDKKTVVPIDFWIGTDFKSLILTGPNTGGKTVTLKTVGLFTLMAQAGLHIPANDGTEIGIFKKVFADIGDEQSIEQSLSTFSSHMTNIVRILANADNQSLVLLDELGAGTDPTEGAALAMSIIENLYNRGAITVATTHYSELKIYALTTPGIENASCEFDVNTLSPKFTLLIGVPGKSNAFAISGRLGLENDILERANQFLKGEDIRFEDVLKTMDENRRMSEQARIEAEQLKLEAKELSIDINLQKQKFETQKDAILKTAREKAMEIVNDAKKDAEETLKELKNLKDKMNRDDSKEAEQLRLKLKKQSDELQSALSDGLLIRRKSGNVPSNLKQGDAVWITDLNSEATVIAPPDAEGNVLVQAGIIKINVHISNLEKTEEAASNVPEGGAGMTGKAKVLSASPETDIRGKTVEEAESIIDKFLDDAALAGIGEVLIIHGKGTGALRIGIHKYLKTSGRAKSYRLGEYGEGDSGVTIVTLK